MLFETTTLHSNNYYSYMVIFSLTFTSKLSFPLMRTKSLFSHLLLDLTGFSRVLKTLSADSTREELLAFLQQYGSHYVSEALYGSELSCSIYFPSKKAQQQLWLQYQKGEFCDRQEERKTCVSATFLTDEWRCLLYIKCMEYCIASSEHKQSKRCCNKRRVMFKNVTHV